MATPKVEIFVTTCRRAEWCLWVIKDIQKESKGVDYNIRIFHDVDPKDNYQKIIAYSKRYKNIYYYKVQKSIGREGYWRVHKYMHSLADKLKFDYLIMLHDDNALVENFTKRAISVLGGNVELCSLWPTNTLHALTQQPTHLPFPKDTFEFFHQAPLETLNGSLMRSTNWSDNCYVATKNAIQGIKIIQPTQKYFQKNPGSGVTYSLIKGYNSKSGKRIYQLEYGLMQHIGFDHSALKGKRNKYIDERHGAHHIYLTDQDYEYTQRKLKTLI